MSIEADEYRSLVEKAAALSDAGKHGDAVDILRNLLHSDLPDVDKSMMCLNLATVGDKMGLREEALQWYDRAIEHEGRERIFAASQKAAYLAGLGQTEESRRLYESLLARPGLSSTDRRGLQQHLERLAAPGVRIHGQGGLLFCLGAGVLGFAVLLWWGYQTGLLSPGPGWVVASVLLLVAVIGLAVTGLHRVLTSNRCATSRQTGSRAA